MPAALLRPSASLLPLVPTAAIVFSWLGCTEADHEDRSAKEFPTLTSAWSDVQEDLRIRIKSCPATVALSDQGLFSTTVTCEIRNVGQKAALVRHLGRLFLQRSEGDLVECQRQEDVADMVSARVCVAPGASTTWQQDGSARIPPGKYGLSIQSDGNERLKSPPVDVTVTPAGGGKNFHSHRNEKET